MTSQILRSTWASRMKSLSWNTTTSPSAVSWTSISIQSAPSSMPRSIAAMVFSGRAAAAPRWAMTSTRSSVRIPSRARMPPTRPATTMAASPARRTPIGRGRRSLVVPAAASSGSVSPASARNSRWSRLARAPVAKAVTSASARAQSTSSAINAAAASRRSAPVRGTIAAAAKPNIPATIAPIASLSASQIRRRRTRLPALTGHQRPALGEHRSGWPLAEQDEVQRQAPSRSAPARERGRAAAGSPRSSGRRSRTRAAAAAR